ncbi:MAG: oligosaccharide repeat unit polymerase [Bacteroidetes bacterium]|nr:oligosaccharide repeat unit polymerase [Bacteroidota bacterium]
MPKILSIAILLLLSVAILLIDSVFVLGQFYFYFLALYILFDVIKNKKISLLNLWNIAFMYIILSEAVIKSDETNLFFISAVKYLLIANNLINIGYISAPSKKMKSLKNIVVKQKINNSKITSLILVLLVLVYFAMSIENALLSFAIGRSAAYEKSEGIGLIIDGLLKGLELVLPAIMVFYFYNLRRKSIMLPLILSLPIFLILFLNGTRYPLLFSVLGFAITYLFSQKFSFSFKKLVMWGFAAYLLFTSVNLMMNFRSGGYDENSGETKTFDASKDLAYNISKVFMSSEGIVDMTTLMFEHFETHDHLYGASSSFLLYFWIPRELWSEKPTMLGHWFIRQYRGGFGEGHSASFGFTGDLYADFGLFSLFMVLLMGALLRRADDFKNHAFKRGGYEVVLGAMFFPYIFFFVRSPITSTMTFLSILLIYYLGKRIIYTKN